MKSADGLVHTALLPAGRHASGVPKLNLKRLAVVGREYRGEKDQGFSPVFADVVRYADQKACDAILFALYTTAWLPQKVLDELGKLTGLTHLFRSGYWM